MCPRAEPQQPPRVKPASQAEVSQYVRKNLWRTAISLGLLFLGLAFIGRSYQSELLSTTEWVYESLGAFGLVAVIFVSDAIFSPLPPDIVLVVIANSKLQVDWSWLVPTIGLVSAVAGNVGWFLGRQLPNFRWTRKIIERIRERHEEKLRRFDRWAVILGAITPLPFSVICVTAGALGMKLERLAPLTLLRVPRYLIVYILIASAAATV